MITIETTEMGASHWGIDVEDDGTPTELIGTARRLDDGRVYWELYRLGHSHAIADGTGSRTAWKGQVRTAAVHALGS